MNIAAKEMIPVVISVAIWGPELARHQVLVRSDNMVVVHALTAGTARDPLLVHLLCCLHFFHSFASDRHRGQTRRGYP